MGYHTYQHSPQACVIEGMSSPSSSSSSAKNPDGLICYEDAIKYWTSVEPSVNGVLGGYGESTSVPKADIVGSLTFVRRLRNRFSNEPGKIKYGLDLGAGIGRVTKNFMHTVCDKVDLLEPVKPFVEKMKIELQPLMKQGKIGEILEISMQDWVPEEPGRYYLIWCQWCCGQLPDADFLKWMDNCRLALQKGGMMVVKENNATGTENNDIYDPVDSSKTRTDANFRALFRKAGWKILSTTRQRGMPPELYPIRMYALQPMEEEEEVEYE
ncbi:DEKNAAC104581 [Brettanomyces naardenensis]|uniref:Alpha N-terminal protein methyltransferase 1 n=1 Tax=Brettanomyces naardenensis TaxID=13370 RepID=A0A448YRM2_BRENA|nr:DEKNAAC104581 [Brettanomyces naardenensis]